MSKLRRPPKKRRKVIELTQKVEKLEFEIDLLTRTHSQFSEQSGKTNQAILDIGN